MFALIHSVQNDVFFAKYIGSSVHGYTVESFKCLLDFFTIIYLLAIISQKPSIPGQMREIYMVVKIIGNLNFITISITNLI